jgi:hypothetical protein
MMTNKDKMIKNKLGLLKLAETLGNVSQACKVMGYKPRQLLPLQRIVRERWESGTPGDQLGQQPYGKYRRRVRSSGAGKSEAVPRDRNGELAPKILHKYETSSNEREDKSVTLYDKRLATRPEAVRKLLYLAHRDIAKKWTMPLPNWANSLNHSSFIFRTVLCSSQLTSYTSI